MNIHKVTNGEPKGIVKSIIGNMQVPKYLFQIYGVGAPQVLFSWKGISGQAIYFCNTRSYCKCREAMASKGVEKLQCIYQIRTSKPNFKFKRVYSIILLEDLYIVAYQNLKFKKIVITSGSDQVTPDKFNINSIQIIIERLRNETFQFWPVRRVKVPKRNGKFRSLSIPSFNDKVIQEVIRIILEAIFEPTFASYSHGFRKSKRCHTALKDVRDTFAGVKWLITRDIKNCFDCFNHHKLVAALEERISDQRFINLIWKFLRVGYIHDFKPIITSLRGVPQGGVVSPLLSNIYINKLDVFIARLIKEFNKGNCHVNDLEYTRYRALLNYWKNKDIEISKAYLYLSNSVTSKDLLNSKYRRLFYVRYADDFIIGVISSIQEAREIKYKVNKFLSTSLSLTTSSSKNELTSASTGRVKFLDIRVSVPIYKEPTFSTYKRTCYGKSLFIKAKSSQGVVKLKVDIKSIIRKLNSAGFCNKLGVPTPRFQLYIISHNDIILIYNRVFLGFKNYFTFRDNFRSIAFSVQYILIRSCAKLLAAKLKLDTTKAVYKKFGKNLNIRGPKFAWSKSYL